jgi:two-component system, OmpR family, phosphate regulon response regulator OmpR
MSPPEPTFPHKWGRSTNTSGDRGSRICGYGSALWARSTVRLPRASGKMAERVLMIEDDESLAAMVGEYLAALGIKVTARATAADGLKLLRHGGFEALILDVMLPDLDGFEVCRQVRAESDIPILMLTARGDEMDRIVGLELGADDYLPKPFNPRELLARLRAILRRRGVAGTQRTASLRFGRMEIDRDARVVRIDGEERPLTSYQFELLCVLAVNAGRVMSRDALMDRVRGEELEAFDRSIDVHISRIRAAIEDDPKHPRRVITVRGAGYVFARRQDDDQEV